jgi:hypothetical protein
MSPALKARYDSLDHRLADFAAKVEGYPVDVQTAPVGKSFSPLEALEHMAKVDKGYVEQIEGSRNHKRIGTPAKPRILYGFVLNKMGTSVEKNAPVPKMFDPSGNVSPSQSTKEWKEARAKVRKRAEEFEDDQTCLVNLFFGTLSPRTLCDLLEKHQDYHDVRLP